MRAAEQKLVIDRLTAEVSIQLVKVILPGGELIGKEIGEGHHLGRRVLRERRCDRSAAISAAKETKSHSGVRLITKRSLCPEKEQARNRSRSCLKELPTVHRSLLICTGVAVAQYI